MTVMTTYLPDEDAGERAIEKVARLVYDCFDRCRPSERGLSVAEPATEFLPL